MHGITLHFASLTALVAAIPHLQNTPGMLTGQGSFPVADQIPGNVAAATTVTPVSTPSPAASTPAASATPPATSVTPPSSQPSFTFEQVMSALTAYNQRDASAFGAAMQKFGFTSFDAIKAAPEKWGELMSYIGAAPAAEPLTFEKVASVLQLWAKVNGAQFAATMQAQGFTDLNAVKANPSKWAELLAAAKATGVSLA